VPISYKTSVSPKIKLVRQKLRVRGEGEMKGDQVIRLFLSHSRLLLPRRSY